jgi:uncharacterized membrane-anchored protein
MRATFTLLVMLLAAALAGWAWLVARKYAARRRAESERAALLLAEAAREAARKQTERTGT